ncbi:MAG: efflux RND transporter periplasmic adaptor subunit [Gammaproteobacteria bacterium]|nr:efflux RND transporter periplasmic adaptor subunit [Gammaproteobacteria bacterium]
MKRSLFIMLLPAIAALAACGSEISTPATPPGQPPITAVVQTVQPEPISEHYTTTGTLIADERVDIAARVMGFIHTIHVKEGQRVTKGQLLLTIDPTETQTQVSEAQARQSQAQARYAEAEADYQRFKALFEQQLVAIDHFRKIELAYRLAGQELHAAQSLADRSQVQLDYTSIRAPVSGIVVGKYKEAGDMATPGTPLLTVENTRQIMVRTYVKEDRIRDITLGDNVELEVEAARLHGHGTVTQVVPSGDPVTFSYLVKITPESTTGLSPGMFARVIFTTGSSAALTIPQTALVHRADLTGVYSIDRDNIAHYRMVRTGRSIDDRIEVLSGITAGDRIIVHSTLPIHSGDRIEAQPPASKSMPAAAGR